MCAWWRSVHSIAVLVSFSLVASVTSVAPVSAQGWPERTVRIIILYAPGGAGDAIARPWAEALTKAFDQQFVVENRGGASETIGVEAANIKID